MEHPENRIVKYILKAIKALEQAVDVPEHDSDYVSAWNVRIELGQLRLALDAANAAKNSFAKAAREIEHDRRLS